MTHPPWEGTLLVAESPGPRPDTHLPVTQLVLCLSLTLTHMQTHTQIRLYPAGTPLYTNNPHIFCFNISYFIVLKEKHIISKNLKIALISHLSVKVTSRVQAEAAYMLVCVFYKGVLFIYLICK